MIRSVTRRSFLAASLTCLAAPLAAEAQQAGKVYRIGWVGVGSDIRAAHSDAFQDGLREFGFAIGRNVSMEYRWLGDRLAPAPDLVTDFVHANVELIVAFGAPAVLSAKQATNTIPIVLLGARDPVEMGIVTSLSHPGGNITGISATVSPSVSGKRLALLKEAVPRISRAGHLWSSIFPGTRPHYEELLKVAGTLNLTVVSFDVSGPEELPGAFSQMKRERVNALTVDPALYAYRKLIVELAAAFHLPACYGNSVFVEEGGLIGYSPDWRVMFKTAGIYSGKLLKGAKPADLPVEQPTKFELIINFKTARALGLTIPPSLLQRADQVIE